MIPSCNTGLGSFTPSIARISFCSSTGSIRKDSIQTLHSMDATHQTLLVKQEMNSPLEATIHSYVHSIQVSSFSSFTSSSYVAEHTQHSFVSMASVSDITLTFLVGWSSSLSVSSSPDSIFSSQLPSFKAAPFNNELFCARLLSSCFSFSSHVAYSPHVASSLPYIASSPLDVLLWVQLFSFVLSFPVLLPLLLLFLFLFIFLLLFQGFLFKESQH